MAAVSVKRSIWFKNKGWGWGAGSPGPFPWIRHCTNKEKTDMAVMWRSLSLNYDHVEKFVSQGKFENVSVRFYDSLWTKLLILTLSWAKRRFDEFFWKKRVWVVKLGQLFKLMGKCCPQRIPKQKFYWPGSFTTIVIEGGVRVWADAVLRSFLF